MQSDVKRTLALYAKPHIHDSPISSLMVQLPSTFGRSFVNTMPDVMSESPGSASTGLTEMAMCNEMATVTRSKS